MSETKPGSTPGLARPTSADDVRCTVEKSASTAARWAATSLAERANALRAVAAELDASAEVLVPVAMADTNLPEQRLRGELKRTTFQLRLFASSLDDGGFLGARVDHADPDWPMGVPRPDLRRILVPVGPVVVFAASNFPFTFSVAGGDTAAALAAGCPVILKAHSGHLNLAEATAEVVISALRDAGAPDGVFTAISGVEAGKLALQDPSVKAGAFTGSIGAGRLLFDIAQSRPQPIPFFGELGSINPVFITRTAVEERLDKLRDELIASFSGSSGQLCTKPGIVLAPAGSGLTESLKTAELPRGARLLNDRITQGYGTSLAALLELDAVNLLAGEGDPSAAEPAPTILVTSAEHVLSGASEVLEECFGPATVVVEYTDDRELAEIARILDGQLTATVQGTDEDDVTDLLTVLTDKAGRILWNEWPTGVAVTHAQQHGGPYPSSTTHTTSVGTAAIERFMRPVAFQGFPDRLLPPALRESNPLAVPRLVDGVSRLSV